MSTGEDLETSATTEVAPPAEAETKTRLNLDVQISDVGPCKKHLKVSIPHEDVEKQFQESVGDMAKEAIVPGFRPRDAHLASSSRSGSASRSPGRSSRPS